MGKITLLSPGEWSVAVAPTVKKLRLAGAIGQSYPLNSAGAVALAGVIEDMATKLDIADRYIKELTKRGN